MLSGLILCGVAVIASMAPDVECLGATIPSPASSSVPARSVINSGSAQPMPGLVNGPNAAAEHKIVLDEAIAQALKHNPQLAALRREILARDAAAMQAGLFPNPDLATTTENFGNSRLRGFDGSATTWQLNQKLELGGKRVKRVRVAGLERDLAVWDYETKRLDIITAARQYFYQTLSAQQRVAITRDLQRLADELRNTVASRARAGKVAPLEETKAAVAAKTAALQLNQAENDRLGARAALIGVMGGLPEMFDQVDGDLNRLPPLPPFAVIAGLTRGNPDIARWVTEIEQRNAVVAGAKAARVPDLTLSAGFREYWNSGDGALVTGLSLPLPLFDRNQGNIQEAYQRLAKAEEEQRSAEVTVRSALERAYRLAALNTVETTTLRSELIPAAKQAFDAAREGYRQGKFGYLEVLDAQRTYFETRVRYVASLGNRHAAVAELERLMGITVDEIGTGK